MRFNSLILFICVLAGCKSDNCECDEFARIDAIFPEPECNAVGGTCVIAEDCFGSLAKQTGLCPKQASQGIECCLGMSRKETRCQKVGGQCIDANQFCNQRLTFSRASDCPNQKCCILV